MKTQKLIALTAIFALAGGALSAQELGAPSPNGNAGKGYIGGGLSTSDMNLKDDKVQDSNGNLVSCVKTATEDCKDKITSNRFYVEGGWAFNKQWEAYARLGLASTKFKNAFQDNNGNWQDLNFNSAAFVGIGLRGSVYENGAFGTGPVAQFNWYADNDKKNVFFTGDKTTLTSHWDSTFGWAVQGKWDMWTVYGGPTYSMIQATGNYEAPGFVAKTPFVKLKEDQALGAYAGFRVAPNTNWRVNVELAYRGGFTGGAGVAFVW